MSDTPFQPRPYFALADTPESPAPIAGKADEVPEAETLSVNEAKTVLEEWLRELWGDEGIPYAEMRMVLSRLERAERERDAKRDEFAGWVAEALGLDSDGVQDAINYPVENLLPLVSDAQIAASRWKALEPHFKTAWLAGAVTHVEAYVPLQGSLGHGRSVAQVADALARDDAAMKADSSAPTLG